MAGVMLKNVYKVYDWMSGDSITAVSDFNLEVKDREIIVFVGPSGCGKTTTLRMIAGLEEITKGELFIDGKLVNNVHPKDRDVALVFQNYALFPHMTVFENIAFGLKPTQMSEDEIREKVEEVAKILEISHLFGYKPRQLSGGQKQRVALGRALVCEHKVILLDEPLSNLDVKLRGFMRLELMKLHQKFKTTFIYVTHDQDEAMMIADRIVVMKDGIIQQVGTPEYIYSHPRNLFVAGFLGYPPMNFFVSKLSETDGNIYVNLGETKIKLPKFKNENGRLEKYIGREVYCGIHPEDMRGDEMGIAKYGDSLIEADVRVRCFRGSEIHLNLTAAGCEFTARVTPDCTAESGDKIKIAVNPGKIYLFNRDTELSITD